MKKLKLISIVLFSLTACQLNTGQNILPTLGCRCQDRVTDNHSTGSNSSFFAVNVVGTTNSSPSVSPSASPTVQASKSPEPEPSASPFPSPSPTTN